MERPSKRGAATTPQRDDEVVIAGLAADGSDVRFEVLAPQGEQPWRWADPHQTLMRLHCKRVPGDGV